MNHLLASLAHEMSVKHKCHTVILYGSHSRGDFSPTSDYDLIGFRKKGASFHEARRIDGAFLDAFVYSEKDTKPANLLRIRGGKVLFQAGRFGDSLLMRIDKIYAKGPKLLSDMEVQARKTWLEKMLVRAKRNDSEGDFRRAWLLTVLLEEYFVLRGRWYEGPKAALAWLSQNDSTAERLFKKALKPGASISAIARLTTLVIKSKQKGRRAKPLAKE